jgi:predicted transposase YbfD/YdcC
MDGASAETGIDYETTVFLNYFRDLPDRRQAGKVAYPLQEVLLLMLMAVLAGGVAFTEIARFGERKIDLLRRFLPFANGTPSHDHLGDIFAALDARAFRARFVAFAAALTGAPPEAIAIPGSSPGTGKTSRRSGGKGAKEAIHVVSAFAASQRLVPGQLKVDARSNEIVVIPALLDMLSIEGAIVTIDAMGCQRDIARKIIDKKADYILALKGNQGTLREDVELFAREQTARGFVDATISTQASVEGDHGRIETRAVTVVHDVGWLQERHDWPGLRGVVIVRSTRELGGKTCCETRYYITSSTRPAAEIAPHVRGHWSIENALHWVMDMNFADDQRRVRTANAAENFVTVKHMAANLARRAPGKDSVRLRLKTASWDDDYLVSLIRA